MTLAPRLQAPSYLALVSGPLVSPHAQQVMCIQPAHHLGITVTSRRQVSASLPGHQAHAHHLQLLTPYGGSGPGQGTRIYLLPGLFPPALAFRTHCMNQEILMEHCGLIPGSEHHLSLPFCRWLLSQVNPMLWWGWS